MNRADESVETRRKRLRFRSGHRGSRELDLILGAFAQRHVENFTAAQLDQYEQLLEIPDPDLYNWLTGQAPVPGAARTDMLELLLSFDPPRQIS